MSCARRVLIAAPELPSEHTIHVAALRARQRTMCSLLPMLDQDHMAQRVLEDHACQDDDRVHQVPAAEVQVLIKEQLRLFLHHFAKNPWIRTGSSVHISFLDALGRKARRELVHFRRS